MNSLEKFFRHSVDDQHFLLGIFLMNLPRELSSKLIDSPGILEGDSTDGWFRVCYKDVLYTYTKYLDG